VKWRHWAPTGWVLSSGEKARGMSANKQDTNVNIIAEGDIEGMLQFIKFKEISKNRQFGL
jgi:hypothetical protein